MRTLNRSILFVERVSCVCRVSVVPCVSCATDSPAAVKPPLRTTGPTPTWRPRTKRACSTGPRTTKRTCRTRSPRSTSPARWRCASSRHCHHRRERHRRPRRHHRHRPLRMATATTSRLVVRTTTTTTKKTTTTITITITETRTSWWCATIPWMRWRRAWMCSLRGTSCPLCYVQSRRIRWREVSAVHPPLGETGGRGRVAAQRPMAVVQHLGRQVKSTHELLQLTNFFPFGRPRIWPACWRW